MRDNQPDLASPILFAATNPVGRFNENCMNDKAVWIESNCGGTSKLMTSTDEPGKCIVIKEISTTNFEQKIGTRYYQVFIEANN